MPFAAPPDNAATANDGTSTLRVKFGERPAATSLDGLRPRWADDRLSVLRRSDRLAEPMLVQQLLTNDRRSAKSYRSRPASRRLPAAAWDGRTSSTTKLAKATAAPFAELPNTELPGYNATVDSCRPGAQQADLAERAGATPGTVGHDRRPSIFAVAEPAITSGGVPRAERSPATTNIDRRCRPSAPRRRRGRRAGERQPRGRHGRAADRPVHRAGNDARSPSSACSPAVRQRRALRGAEWRQSRQRRMHRLKGVRGKLHASRRGRRATASRSRADRRKALSRGSYRRVDTASRRSRATASKPRARVLDRALGRERRLRGRPRRPKPRRCASRLPRIRQLSRSRRRFLPSASGKALGLRRRGYRRVAICQECRRVYRASRAAVARGYASFNELGVAARRTSARDPRVTDEPVAAWQRLRVPDRGTRGTRARSRDGRAGGVSDVDERSGRGAPGAVPRPLRDAGHSPAGRPSAALAAALAFGGRTRAAGRRLRHERDGDSCCVTSRAAASGLATRGARQASRRSTRCAAAWRQRRGERDRRGGSRPVRVTRGRQATRRPGWHDGRRRRNAVAPRSYR